MNQMEFLATRKKLQILTSICLICFLVMIAFILLHGYKNEQYPISFLSSGQLKLAGDTGMPLGNFFTIKGTIHHKGFETDSRLRI